MDSLNGYPEPLNLAYLRAFGSWPRPAARRARLQRCIARSRRSRAPFRSLRQRRRNLVRTPLLGHASDACGRVVIERCERIFAELEELAQWCAARQSRRRSVAEGTPAYLLNTRRLQLFSALARHRHMPSAAQTRDQPACGDSAIRIMESGAGMQLFYRSPAACCSRAKARRSCCTCDAH